jgi:hypothetical protein
MLSEICAVRTAIILYNFIHDSNLAFPPVAFLFVPRIYESRWQSSWTHLITPSRNILEVRWRSLFRSTSLGKRCTSYNAPPTSRNVLHTVDHFGISCLVGEIWTVWRMFYWGSTDPLFPSRSQNSIQISPHAISGLFQPWKDSSEARNLEVINDLQHIFEKWVERCKKCIAFQGRYFEKRNRHRPSTKSDSE